jgi:ribonucleoside-diphosphate reductase alpha chain
MTLVIKKDGRIVSFDINKIVNAVMKAMLATNEIDKELCNKIAQEIQKKFDNNDTIYVEDIQDEVENKLIKLASQRLAKSYILYRTQRQDARELKDFLGIKDDLKLGANAIALLEKRYLRKIDDKKETPSQMFKRVAKAVASAEKLYGGDEAKWTKTFYNMMSTQIFMPSTPILCNAGHQEANCLFACHFLEVKDSIDSIFSSVKDAAIIQKLGGGIGLSFSNLRPAGDLVKTTNGISSGVITFMRVFDVTSDVIKQGSIRRGGNLGLLDVSHPEILDFIKWKDTEGVLSNFNISVGLTDLFMKKVIEDGSFDLINPRDNKVWNTVNAKELFHTIAQQAWKNGEPGIVFIDKINDANPTKPLGRLGVNLCITGDTLLAVADGRGTVSIKQLTEEGKDCPVYCKDSSGWTHIRKARNFRKTQTNAKILKVTLDDGSFVRVTENHGFYLSNGNKVEAKDLLVGTSLMGFDKTDYTDLKKHVGCCNHKVVSVTFDGYEDVFNTTVDEFHNYCVVTSNEPNKLSGITLANCGELPLLDGESCNLGSINVSKFVDLDKRTIVWGGLKKTIQKAIRFLDNVIDVSTYPTTKSEKVVKGNRKLGLGLMGFADMLYLMKISYNSPEALEIADKLMSFFSAESIKASEELAAERGSFPNKHLSIFTGQRRNATVNSIAPTGSISIISECSSGIEPNFGLVHSRSNILEGRTFIDLNKSFDILAKREGFISDKLINDVLNNGGSISKADIPKEWKDIFVIAHEVTMEQHIRIQAVFQKHIDNSVSKTVNSSSDSTVADFEKAILLAYELGCKGLTLYRDKSREKQVLNKDTKCPECHSDLVYSEGCAKCVSCYYSVCLVG